MTRNNNQRESSVRLYRFAVLALLISVELAMKLLGLGSVPVGPLNMSFLTLPIAVGAMLLGPVEGAVMGCVFGLCSLWDALSGRSVMTGIFFGLSPIHTIILCVGTRTLMGWCTGLIYGMLKKYDAKSIWSYFAGAFFAPFLNTLFFMGYIVLVFYRTDYIQGLVAAKGATNALMFVVLLVGVQGLVEMLVCTIAGGAVAKGVSAATKRRL